LIDRQVKKYSSSLKRQISPQSGQRDGSLVMMISGRASSAIRATSCATSCASSSLASS